MNPQEEARRIFDGCHKLIDRYKTVEVVFHHRILAKHFSVMIVDEILKELMELGQIETLVFWNEVKRILIEEYIWKPDKPTL